jgi:pyruvate kinase
MKNMKRTKIIATLGPASDSKKTIIMLIKSGVNAFRLNFSHGSYEAHLQLIELIKEAREELSAPVGIMQDLSGPKIRIGDIGGEPMELKAEDELILDPSIEGRQGNRLSVTHKGIAEDVQTGHSLLLADGAIELRITAIEPPIVKCRVVDGGILTSKKGINYLEGSFKVPSVTEKDINDLKYGLEHGIDMVAVSFVRKAEDIELVRNKCREIGREVPLIGKIEKHEAVENLGEIIDAVDGLIVARGDLGVEIPLEKVPGVQKRIIAEANLRGKPVIIATQMLASMVRSPRPTRAEVTDIANAILDGADALLLSEETAIGKYPVESIETMSSIAKETELDYPYGKLFPSGEYPYDMQLPIEIALNAADIANALSAPIIFCPTSSGFTAMMLSRFRPEALIYALTSDDSVYYNCGLLWGVIPRKVREIEGFDEELMCSAREMAKNDGLLEDGDYYVITAGFPFGAGTRTNMITAGIYRSTDCDRTD